MSCIQIVHAGARIWTLLMHSTVSHKHY